MGTGSNTGTSTKAKWEAPVLNELDLGLGNVENGTLAGTDGAGGFTPTSLS